MSDMRYGQSYLQASDFYGAGMVASAIAYLGIFSLIAIFLLIDGEGIDRQAVRREPDVPADRQHTRLSRPG